MKVMVFDVGGTEIKYSVMDEELKVYHNGSVPTPMDNIEHFVEIIKNVYARYSNSVDGIAMSLPGFVDTANGVVKGGGALKYNRGQAVGQILSQACGCKVKLVNDGKAAAIAELWQGALVGCSNASVFIIGTGVGGGLIVDGKVVMGKDATAGEFSFINVDINNWSNLSSKLAMNCSTSGLIMMYKEKKGLEDVTLDGRIFFSKVAEGEADAIEVLEKFCRNIAIQVYNLSALLNLEKVAIGGGISKQPILVETINKQLQLLIETDALHSKLPMAEVVNCHFSSEANQVGALYTYIND